MKSLSSTKSVAWWSLHRDRWCKNRRRVHRPFCNQVYFARQLFFHSLSSSYIVLHNLRDSHLLNVRLLRFLLECLPRRLCLIWHESLDHSPGRSQPLEGICCTPVVTAEEKVGTIKTAVLGILSQIHLHLAYSGDPLLRIPRRT